MQQSLFMIFGSVGNYSNCPRQFAMYTPLINHWNIGQSGDRLISFTNDPRDLSVPYTVSKDDAIF